MQPPLKKLKTITHCPCCSEFEEWRETESDEFTMLKGKYYVGDLSYVLRSELDREIESENGLFELSDGRLVGCFMQEHFQDNDKCRDIDFHVTSGMIGITLLAGLEEQWVPPADCEKCFEWGRLGGHLKAIFAAGKKVTMMDYINNVGTIVEYDADFKCQTNTISHYKHDDHMTQITFGDQINISTCHGRYNSDDVSEEEDNDETDDEPEAEDDAGLGV